MSNQLVKAENPNYQLIVSVIDRNAVSNLLPAERKIIEAALQPKIDEQPPVDVVTTFVALITQAYTRAGYKIPDEDTLALYADEFYQSTLEKYPRVTIPEVREALKEGVYGAFGEFTGLNPKTFMQFISGYIMSSARKEAIKQFENKRDFLKMQKDLSPEELEVNNKSFVNSLYEDHKAGNLITDFIPVFVYDFLEAQGKIILSNEEKNKIKVRADTYFNRLKVSKRYQTNQHSIGDEMATYIRNRDESKTIKNICKQFAVGDFFDIQAKAEIKTIFTSPKLLT